MRLLLLLLAALAASGAPPADRVLILVNDNTPREDGTGETGASIYVGQHYADRRGISRDRIFHLSTSTDERISLADYQSQIETPLKTLLDAGGGALRKQILYIVSAYGVPVQVRTPQGGLSVDTMLAAMYAPAAPATQLVNPYHAGVFSRPQHFAAWADERESAGLWKMFLATRLDGPGATIAAGLVDKALNAEANLNTASGTAYFDYQGSRVYPDWQYFIDEEIRSTSALTSQKGFATVLNTQYTAACNALLHPAGVYYYDPAAGNVYMNATGAESSMSFGVSPVSQADFTVRLKSDAHPNLGPYLKVTLGSADPGSYIQVSYPMATFDHYSRTADFTIRKFVAGTQAASAAVTFQSADADAINGLTELRIAVRDAGIAVYANGTLLAKAADPGATPLPVATVTVAGRCWTFRLTGLSVTDVSSASVWQDDFSSDTTANYAWNMAAPQGQNALWVWGWYGLAFDTYRFVDGAVGAQFTSYTAVHLRKPDNPDPLVASDGSKRWGGNWVPRMLEEGVTATWGTVDEPYAAFYPQAGNVFDHFWAGYDFAESFYITANVLRWTITAVGDPLYAPPVFQSSGPSISAVLNLGSGQIGPVAPGEAVAIIGSQLGPASRAGGQLNAAGLLDAEVQGTRVLFAGQPAPILNASANQVVAFVPYSAADSTYVQVEVNGTASTPAYLAVEPAAPGLLTRDGSGTGQASITNEDGSANSASNPAPKGSVVTIFGTGDGATDPPGIDGKPTPAEAPKTLAPVTVRIGDIRADVQSAGGAANQVAGIFQVRVKIPDAAPSGASVPVTVTIGGKATQPGVTMAVQ